MIAAVGSRAEAENWPAAEVIDFGAAVLTPGLVDCHMHPVLGLELTRGCDLSGAKDLAGVRALLRAEAAATAAGDWVRGWGLDPNVFGSAAAHRELIDDVVSGRPCLIRLFDGHSALASSRALELAGVTGPREFDQASEVVCDGSGRPTGLLLEAAAIELVARVMPAESFDERKARLARTLHAVLPGRADGRACDGLRGRLAGALPCPRRRHGRQAFRCACGSRRGACPAAARRTGAGSRNRSGLGGRRWDVAGIKLFVDGTVDNGTAWLFEPDSHGESVAPFWPRPEEYAAAVQLLCQPRDSHGHARDR